MRDRLYPTLKEECLRRRFEKEHGRQDSTQWHPVEAEEVDEVYRDFRRAMAKYIAETFR